MGDSTYSNCSSLSPHSGALQEKHADRFIAKGFFILTLQVYFDPWSETRYVCGVYRIQPYVQPYE